MCVEQYTIALSLLTDCVCVFRAPAAGGSSAHPGEGRRPPHLAQLPAAWQLSEHLIKAPARAVHLDVSGVLPPSQSAVGCV